MEEWTILAISEALKKHQENRKRGAEPLGISRTTLLRWVKKLEEG
jgi:transcriptional regulator with PAS, ATPase and Fis domain